MNIYRFSFSLLTYCPVLNTETTCLVSFQKEEVTINLVVKINLAQVEPNGGRGRDCGSTVVKVLRYKSEGGWFDPRWCYGNFY
jgi:hypothetical protein